MGCDIDARMVEIAKANAQVAGVAGDITFKQMRVQDLCSDKINGVIIPIRLMVNVCQMMQG